MSREVPYSGPSDANDFDALEADEMAAVMHAYRLLGDCFEDSTDDEMFGRGFYLDDPLALVRPRIEDRARIDRELRAAVHLARYRGQGWEEIGEVVAMRPTDAMQVFRDD